MLTQEHCNTLGLSLDRLITTAMIVIVGPAAGQKSPLQQQQQRGQVRSQTRKRDRACLVTLSSSSSLLTLLRSEAGSAHGTIYAASFHPSPSGPAPSSAHHHLQRTQNRKRRFLLSLSALSYERRAMRFAKTGSGQSDRQQENCPAAPFAAVRPKTSSRLIVKKDCVKLYGEPGTVICAENSVSFSRFSSASGSVFATATCFAVFSCVDHSGVRSQSESTLSWCSQSRSVSLCCAGLRQTAPARNGTMPWFP